MWEQHKTSIIAVGVALVALLSTVVIIPETQQGVKIRAGQPVYTVNQFKPDQQFGETGAGIWYRIPLYERIQMVDRRVLDLEMERQEVLAIDQQRLVVDAYARLRIIDPVLMVERAGTEAQLRMNLLPIMNSALRQELGRRTFASLLTPERGNAMTNIKTALDIQARQYGAQILDVRIKRADLPEGTPLQAAFSRMESDRQEEAGTIRAVGARDARIITSEAQASAANIYAEAYNKDPEFYDFYRAMQSYRATFESDDSEAAIIMSPDNEYLRQFRGG
ncbi:protease modulator HflC [Altererythrobacter sp. KTW20L]|uniref:protease modulator HflC n=1 Tax=Altererythrobacter sp. KTW20L TaxID=2942210 RepID=UPI0020C0F5AD|nr:protease modulator HflC [Altererythrobacter sp. KTW20L]MCL6252016.1 protease modulator HflC [Altererythrobacter sp. KTW20L]